MLKKAPAVYCMKCTARANFGEKQQGVNKKRQIRKEAGERQEFIWICEAGFFRSIHQAVNSYSAAGALLWWKALLRQLYIR